MSLLVDWDWKWDFVHARGRMTNPPSADRVAIGRDTAVSDSGACVARRVPRCNLNDQDDEMSRVARQRQL